MSPEQVKLVQESWKKVVPIADQAAALFYARLFEIDGSLERLFKSDLKSQGRKLTSMLNTAVVNLDNVGAILPAVEDLGRRHVGYGVQPRHYGTVGVALISTLEKGLGKDFTPDVRAAWIEAYGALSAIMQSAAAEVDATPATVAG